ncbi:hypothetical protein [Tichowtungia aerotolerans]|uniref:Uncharacterized protein n=1 Tax=Tichowtungia aerotolerans TaxID=2697043 RepID=A0A6P1M4P9_9BACT|nr:hypothetical protein [Tichowtungia aerotolerans]QHI68821.1 hypothetical protein GT409_04940 [Tichowtungia aerotolerans]
MKLMISIFILLVCTWTAAATGEGFERYKIIIDKHPFGEDPPEADTVQVAPGQSFAKNLRLSMLFEGPNGDVRVGIIDKAEKKNYILNIGEIQNGIELIEADINKSEAMLKKGNEVALFKLEEGAPEPVSKQQQQSRQSSYAERRRALLKKIEERRKEEEPKQPQLTGEALRKHLEEVQMDAIRTGKPPLPMPLTPEMDAQLVQEGVLPPQ